MKACPGRSGNGLPHDLKGFRDSLRRMSLSRLFGWSKRGGWSGCGRRADCTDELLGIRELLQSGQVPLHDEDPGKTNIGSDKDGNGSFQCPRIRTRLLALTV